MIVTPEKHNFQPMSDAIPYSWWETQSAVQWHYVHVFFLHLDRTDYYWGVHILFTQCSDSNHASLWINCACERHLQWLWSSPLLFAVMSWQAGDAYMRVVLICVARWQMSILIGPSLCRFHVRAHFIIKLRSLPDVVTRSIRSCNSWLQPI